MDSVPLRLLPEIKQPTKQQKKPMRKKKIIGKVKGYHGLLIIQPKLHQEQHSRTSTLLPIK